MIIYMSVIYTHETSTWLDLYDYLAFSKLSLKYKALCVIYDQKSIVLECLCSEYLFIIIIQYKYIYYVQQYSWKKKK
jgi:hypothetical protein